MNAMSSDMAKAKDTGSKMKNYAELEASSEFPEINDVRKDLKALREDVGALSRHVYDDGGQAIKNFVRRQVERVGHRVEEKPGQTLAMAFFAGIAASFLLGRRR